MVRYDVRGCRSSDECERGALQRQGCAPVRHHDRGVGRRRHGRRRAHRRAAVVAGAQLRYSVAHLQPPAPAAHERRDLRVRRLGVVRHVLSTSSSVRVMCDCSPIGSTAFTFWGWQAVIVLAAITLPLGITQSKEYAELEWPIDLLIAIVWVAYGVVFFGTIVKRRVKHIYVANWFFAPTSSRSPYCISSTTSRSRCRRPSRTSCTPASSTPWCSGGTAITRSASSSPPASSE